MSLNTSERNRLLREFANDIAASVAPVLGLPVPKCSRITHRRGHGHYGTFSVPSWAAEAPTDYFIYYVAHEVCHTGGIFGHGPDFRVLETKAMTHLGYVLEYQNGGKGPYVNEIRCIKTRKILARRVGNERPTI